MKIKHIISIFVLLISVDKSFGQIEGLWAGIYSSKSTTEEKNYLSNEKFIEIKDSKIINFEFRPIFNQAYEGLIDSIEIIRDTIELLKGKNSFFTIRSKNNRIDTARVIIRGEKLVYVYRNNKIVFVRIPHFDNIDNKSSIVSHLTNKILDISNGDYEDGWLLKYLPENRSIQNQLNEYGWRIPYWCIKEINERYFILTFSNHVRIAQIKKMNRDSLVAVFYASNQHSEFRFPLSKENHIFNKSLILGKWEKINSYTTCFEFDSMDLDTIGLAPYETLVFNDSLLTMKYDSITLSTPWEVHLHNKVILLPKLKNIDVRETQWAITRLTNDKLIIKRMRGKKNPGSDSNCRTIEFIKIE